MIRIVELIRTIVLPMCLGFLCSNAFRNGNYASVFVAALGIIVYFVDDILRE